MTEKLWRDGIARYRTEIDEIDKRVVEVLASRFEVAKKVAALKQVWRKPVVQRDRAVQVERSYIAMGEQYQLSEQFMSRLYRLIHEETCRMEREMIQGECAGQEN
ncbi:hypothetical protein AAC03nite_11710 [Alicyclobacillus acidoterrestris]|uniref:chorismate mutase n=1 Tax=Alicyclobacillus suci TaxID=2816080 RepID=UPI001194267E|nr:chorismate mutase [Alicyclobacillus suci]GEO25386.1 hypothetical protein AAC03nite_11710 [Alicyclobacillus acidoterrestris]